MAPTSCQRCRQNFKSDAALQTHTRDSVMHNVCPICSYDFPTALGLTQHFVFGPTPPYCVLCGQQFVTYCSMIKHYKAVPHHRCTSCSSVFFSEIELQEHYSADHWYCLSCKYMFESEKDLIMHLRSVHGDCYCEACDFVFSSEARLHDHHRKEHPYCTGCRRTFKNQDALNIHLQSSVHQWRCELCSTSFNSEVDLHEHNRKNHVYCSDCKVVFGDEKALVNHLKTSVVHILCCDLCSTVFSSKEELHDHYADEHMYCGDCKRVFRGKIDLRTHLRSSHHNARTVHCPGRDRKKSCQKSFLSGAGLINHLESGACPSHMNRHHVNRLAVELDSNNTLTNASRLLTGPGGSRVPPLIAAPSRATSLSWNGSKFECVLCHKEFSHLERLNQHLNSPAHDEEIYKCPRGWQGCGTEFSTLSALCQHVESEQCGVHRFNKAMQEMVGSLTSDMHRLTM